MNFVCSNTPVELQLFYENKAYRHSSLFAPVTQVKQKILNGLDLNPSLALRFNIRFNFLIQPEFSSLSYASYFTNLVLMNNNTEVQDIHQKSTNIYQKKITFFPNGLKTN